MSEHRATRAIFPGTFDPITNGHLDIIRRGAELFDELIVAVGQNPEKQAWLGQAQRTAMIREVLAEEDLPSVRAEAFEGLTVDFARREHATAILRGIRDSSDLHYEFQVALTNRVVAGMETVFIITSTEHAFTSSSLIRQIASMGGDVSAMVPPKVLDHLDVSKPAERGDAAINETE
ncbi:MAG: pantetheine-phosphate adenylyltransferase [Planctomycetota bacterium]